MTKLWLLREVDQSETIYTRLFSTKEGAKSYVDKEIEELGPSGKHSLGVLLATISVPWKEGSWPATASNSLAICRMDCNFYGSYNFVYGFIIEEIELPS